MKRKWKSLSALCLAAVLGLSMPLSTMMAAEENVETADDVQETDSDSNRDNQGEAIESQEQIVNEEQDEEVVEEQDTQEVVEQDGLQDDSDVAAPDEIQDNVQDDSVIEDSEPVSEQPPEEISLIPENNVAIESQTESVYTTSDFGSLPVIELKYQWMHLTQSLDVDLRYDIYVNNCDQSISISISEGSVASLSYYLDKSGSNESMNEEQLSSLWQPTENISNQEISMNQDGKYVLYVKAVAENGQIACVRTIGLVVDSVHPVITEIQDGGTYPEGTKFGVEDANLDTVFVNEQPVSPSDDGKYQVAANGTSCIIRAKDKAGHETIYSITIGEEKPVEPEKPDKPEKPDDPKPGDDITVIDNSGTYSLHAGTAYRLDSGSWTLQGDSAVYKGGITFYVNTDGDYTFKKD